MITTISRFSLALAMTLLAASIVYFASILKSIEKSLPIIAEQTQIASESISMVTAKVGDITPYIPGILDEAAKLNKNVEDIIEESIAIRQEGEGLRLTIDKISSAVPNILKESENIRLALPEILEESRHLRETTGDTVEEVRRTRESLPGTISDLHALIDKADKTGKKVSEGALSGLITGIFKAPFTVVKDLSSSIGDGDQPAISRKDISIINAVALDVLNNAEVGGRRLFEASESSIKGFIELERESRSEGMVCKHLRIHTGRAEDVLKIACISAEGVWSLQTE
jgi:hypothetical protein